MMIRVVCVLGFAKNPQKGALTTINCAVNPTLNSQQAVFYADCKLTRAPPAAM